MGALSPWHCGDQLEHAAHEWELDGKRYSCVGTTAEGAEIARRARFGGRRVELAPAPIVWGSTMCKRRRCVEIAACAIDGEPYCIPHADEEIERAGIPSNLAAQLPPLDEIA